MKTKIFLFLLTFPVIGSGLSAQSNITKSTIKVYGNCVLCKKRIETVLDHKGIKRAVWDTQTKNLEVVYNSSKITELQIEELVASVGHDTDKVKAKDEVYASLPFCCLYRDSDHKSMEAPKQ